MAFITWLGKQLWQSAKEARQGRKDEAQKIARERDQWKQKAESRYNRKQRYKDVLWETRRIAIEEYHVPSSALPEVPPDDH